MNTTELTEYIKNYLENDRTSSAIMLTGEWGCGKSYYIQNILTTELNNTKQDVAVVSLYGVKSIADLNKSIYLELRAKKVINKLSSKFTSSKKKKPGRFHKISAWFKKHCKEVASGSLLVGKTIVKGVAGFFNVPVECSDRDLERLFASINLDNKLIVLEDLERSGIDIVEIMGYVNNLVEQDGVKVLLVANENEIIQYESNNADDENSKLIDNTVKKDKKQIHTERTIKYLRIKEKTVSDTIKFNVEQHTAIKGIISKFDSVCFAQILKKDDNNLERSIEETIIDIMDMLNIHNLRAILFACQKANDLFGKIDGEVDVYYFKAVFCGIVAFALRLSQNSNLIWTDNLKSPTELGCYHYPLYKYCYDYIKMQYLDSEQCRRDEIAFIKQKDFEVKQKDLQSALDILYDFFDSTEKEVSNAVRKIYSYLHAEENHFPLAQYSKLANYLIAARSCIDDEKVVDECKKQILLKIKSTVLNSEIIHDLTYHDGVELWTVQQQDEYNAFKTEILNNAKVDNVVVLEKITSADDIQKLSESIYANIERYIGKQNFAGQLDINGILHVLPDCNPKIISSLRGAIMALYRSANIKDFLGADKLSLVKFKEGIEKLINEDKIDDKVKKLQLEWFIGNLEDIIKRLG